MNTVQIATKYSDNDISKNELVVRIHKVNHKYYLECTRLSFKKSYLTIREVKDALGIMVGSEIIHDETGEL